MKTTPTTVIAVAVFLASVSANAQLDDERKNYVFFSALYDVQPLEITAERPLTLYVEAGTYRPLWEREPSVSFGVGYVRDLFSGFSVGVSVQGVNADAKERFTAEVPHPYYFNRPRDAEGESADLSYKELAVHLPIGFTRTFGRIVISVGAGPSYFFSRIEVIEDLNLNETYPYTSVTVGAVDSEVHDADVFGFHAGGVFGIRVSNNFALGVDIRFSRGRASFTNSLGDEVEFDAGGLWAGVGLQVMF